MKPTKVVLAYSGGLDTSVAIPWLKEHYDCEVIAMLADVGQGEDLEAAAEKALAIGACQAFIEDLRTEFVRDYFFRSLRAGARYPEWIVGAAIFVIGMLVGAVARGNTSRRQSTRIRL